MTLDNCTGTDGSGAAKWNEAQCVSCGDNDWANCTTYNVSGHPHHNAMDCAGVCLNNFNDGTYAQAFIDSTYADIDGDGWGDPSTGRAYCTNESIPTDRSSNNYDINDDVFCDSNIIDCAGVCHDPTAINIRSDGFPNANGDCVFVIYPGDANMDGVANQSDINSIVKYWGQTVSRRNTATDLEGNKMDSEFSWSPQFISLERVQDSCKVSADANGDGRIGINDVLAVFVNFSKSSHSYLSTSGNCLSAARTSDIDIYYSIYKSLPPSELRNSISEAFGFEELPNSFVVYENFPNPFNSITSINFEVPYRGNIKIHIVNVNGQLLEDIDLLVDSGYSQYKWNAYNYSSGIYYYQIYFDGILKANNKMVYLK